ncbi:hypothetical protein [Lentzea albidocapillata]|uniref:Uncharacterized protein n=1 Tax=Lentzea albidocapillata TaxID=40571 RepID=A0A1W2CGG7_9PSEU|nr:hypothetical protein [Lentzea albidocapillata]SMC83962.1 hypothetical protein SAMN05660733_01983 [Lentzea albidocapillata]
MRDERPQVVLGHLVGVAAQHLQALPRHHPVDAGHVRQRRRALAADLEAVVVQRAGHPPRRHQRVRMRQGQADDRHADHVLAAVERRVDLLRAGDAHQRRVVVPVHALAAHRPVQQEPLPAVGAFAGAVEVGGQIPPHGRGVGTAGRGQDPAQLQHVLALAGLRELTQDTGRAAQVLPRQPRQRRHLVDGHPAVGAAPPDLGWRQRGPAPGVFERDHAQTCGTARSRARV